MNKMKAVAVIVAHPDDEALWAGGTILMHPRWNFFIISLCRAGDPDRAPRFFNALRFLGAEGKIGDLDDGPDQVPLPEGRVQQHILHLLSGQTFDLVITHDIHGEYTRHLRHEETARAVVALWYQGKITMKELWMFAYEDGKRRYLPQPVKTADCYTPLPAGVWQKKYKLVTEIYGFAPASWEARTVPKAEAYRQFATAADAQVRLDIQGELS
ncbi:MAG TPA: PIG-L family deacetylase [Chitinophagaceae bacterium]|nr:PIG-L family deacetylase [Chitinophagaceae bacterium]